MQLHGACETVSVLPQLSTDTQGPTWRQPWEEDSASKWLVLVEMSFE